MAGVYDRVNVRFEDAMALVNDINRHVSNALVAIGARLPRPAWVRLESVARRSQVERFLRALGGAASVVPTRLDVYAHAADAIGSAQPVTYLEFGVHEGQSMRYFAERLGHADTRLHGFDSFEGLPEDWDDRNPKGTFSTGGQAPAIDDPRVTFHVGWFDDTLPGFSLDRRGPLLVNVDCDLYRSTVTVLDAVIPLLQPGDRLYFDEFADLEHELKAFRECLSTSGLVVACEVRSATWNNVLFRVVRPART
jgi:hypothetical protein